MTRLAPTPVALISLVELVLSLLACLVFTVLFHTRTSGVWRATPLGRNIMVLMAVMGSILLLSLARLVFGDYPGREWVVAILFGVYTVVLWGRVRLLNRISRSPRDATRNTVGTDEEAPR